MVLCKCTTVNDKKCKSHAMKGSNYCFHHQKLWFSNFMIFNIIGHIKDSSHVYHLYHL